MHEINIHEILSPEAISGYLTSAISDHLPQCIIDPMMFWNPLSNETFERHWSNFDQENFIIDYFSIGWNEALKIDKQYVNYSSEVSLNKVSLLLDNYAPL